MHFVEKKYINFNNYETKSKMENPTQNWETVMSWSSRKKKVGICTFILSDEIFFQHICFISMYSVLNTLSDYTFFYILKNITSYNFVLVFKIV